MLLEQNQREEYNVSALLTPGLIVNPVPRGMVFSPSHQRISEGTENFPVALPFQIKTLRQRGELSRVPKSGRWDFCLLCTMGKLLSVVSHPENTFEG